MPQRKRLLWLLYPSFLIITLAALLTATLYSSHTLRQFYIRETEADLTMKAQLLQVHLTEHFSKENSAQAIKISHEFGERFKNRITVVLADGTVIADSEEHPDRMMNHGERPEIRAALEGRRGIETRFSETVGTDMLYVAIPVMLTRSPVSDAPAVDASAPVPELAGVIRVSVPLLAIKQTLHQVYARMILGGLLVAVLTALVSLVVSRRISKPIEELRRGAERFAAGDLRHKLQIPDSREFGALAEAMNLMAVQLGERIRSVIQHKNHLQALLTSMVEGVLAVDNRTCLTSINETAARLFNVDAQQVRGRMIQHAVRNADLIEFIGRILTTQQPAEAELVLRAEDGQEISLQAHGALLHDSQDQKIGAVVVLNDLTRLRRLERIRSDFVANVSHELKTPVTSIKGFVETLQEGALQDTEAATRFLGIIGRQADRLTAIIDDLLSLSRIEQEEKVVLVREPATIADVISTAVDVCQMKADTGKLKIVLECLQSLQANMNAPLIEQAVINLLDNAIQYSPAGGTVTIAVRQTDSETIISVNDTGCGISEEHVSRIFERFYRVDKGRSRSLGGTGLGLSIVKHIVQLHGGTLAVKSTPGKGSTFEIHLPRE